VWLGGGVIETKLTVLKVPRQCPLVLASKPGYRGGYRLRDGRISSVQSSDREWGFPDFDNILPSIADLADGAKS
jgi:hypothetical protein